MTSDNLVSKQAAALVAYEYRTMRETSAVLVDLDTGGPAEGESKEDVAFKMRVYLESFLVHYRNLLDFLSPRKTVHATDVTAGPFVGETRRYCMPGVPIDYRSDIDKRLSHISIERGDGQQYWQGCSMTDRLIASYEDFLSLLDEDKRSWFTNPTLIKQDHIPGFYNS